MYSLRTISSSNENNIVNTEVTIDNNAMSIEEASFIEESLIFPLIIMKESLYYYFGITSVFMKKGI